MYKLPNYTMVNYASLGEQIQQIDDDYPYSTSTWLIALITVLGTLMTGVTITIPFYRKYKNTPNHSKTSSIFWHKENPKEPKSMLSGSPQHSIGYQRIKVTPEKVRETLEMLELDFFDFHMYKAYRNSKDKIK